MFFYILFSYMAQTLQHTYYIGPYIIYSNIKPSTPLPKLLKISNIKIEGWKIEIFLGNDNPLNSLSI